MKPSGASYSATVCFLVLVSVFACTSYWIAFNDTIGVQSSSLVLLQFSPAAAAFVTRLYFQHNLQGFGWRWGKTRYQIISYTLPFVLCLVGFGLVWLLGFGELDSASFVEYARSTLADTFSITVTSRIQ